MRRTAFITLAAVCFAIGLSGYLCYARATQSSSAYDKVTGHELNFAGPLEEVPPQVPPGSGFWSFSIVVPGVLSRSGQPSMADFQWLKDHGWKSIINLRTPQEIRWFGFKRFNFTYLSLPIDDNTVPTDKQAQEFLDFVTSTYNQPVHIYCHAGVGRTGVMIALYRYTVQGWPMLAAIIEADLRGSGINRTQAGWLKSWAQTHKRGSFSLKKDNTKSK